MRNYDDFVEIKITKVKDEVGEFIYWEYEVKFDDKESYAGGGIGSTFHDVYDDAFQAIRNVGHLWMSNDANFREDE